VEAPLTISDQTTDRHLGVEPIHSPAQQPKLSIAILAWNEEKVIGSALVSLFRQSLFREFARRDWRCEIVCVVNGCSDSTPVIARSVFSDQSRAHPFSASFTSRVEEIAAAGKLNAWNQFVHSLSARSAEFLIMMDADITLNGPETLWRMVQELERDAAASVTVDTPRKHVEFNRRGSPADWLSLRMTNLTGAAPAQLCGQLYCIRSEIARNIYLPRDLGACEDGFIKALVCSDFLSRAICAARIKLAPDAEHIFEAYTSPAAIFRNQKRQMIGQTVVHVLIDKYLPALSPLNRLTLSEFLRKKDESEPNWLKLLIRDHLRSTKFWWRLYPGLMTQRFQNLWRLPMAKRIICFPAALASSALALLTSYAAWRTLKRGATSYWPKAPRMRAESPQAHLASSCPDRFATPITTR
jgi:glycosyltransferase involved in cell wall biosynthesis